MAAKEFTYRGKTLEELKELEMKNLIKLMPSRQRRSLMRESNQQKEVVLKKIAKGSKNIETHARDLIIIPSMVGHVVKVHSGKEFVPVQIEPEMIGHYLGEFAQTRKKVGHSAPGVGATRSSASVSVR